MMLANRWTGQPVTGWHLSEKLDGCRAFWDGTCFRTKDSWARIDAPEALTARLPRGVALDGELWAGRGTFEMMRVLVQFTRHWHPDWERVRYMVFDWPTTDGILLERRFELARQHAERAGAGWVEQRRCAGADDALRAMREIVAAGGEGCVLRRPKSHYHFGRCSDWLKVKPAGVD